MDIMADLAISYGREMAMDFVMDQLGKALLGSFVPTNFSSHSSWGGNPGAALLVSTLANLCHLNHHSCLLRFLRPWPAV